MSYFRANGGNCYTILIERSCTIQSSLCSDSKSNPDAPKWCPLILVSDQCFPRDLLHIKTDPQDIGSKMMQVTK